jgi:hypothetical protein
MVTMFSKLGSISNAGIVAKVIAAIVLIDKKEEHNLVTT